MRKLRLIILWALLFFAGMAMGGLGMSGVDSLMAVELRNRLGANLKLRQQLPATLIFKYPTIEALVKYLSQDVLALNTSATHAARVTESKDSDSAIAEIAALSGDEIRRLLDEELSSLAPEPSDLDEG